MKAVRCALETMRGMRTDIEVSVERQFGGIRQAASRRFSQPEPAFEAVKAQDGVSAIRCAA